jgi:hypothetical protein
LKNTIIFDLDGTIAIIDKRRIKAGSPSGKRPTPSKMDWDVFHDPSNIKLDEPNTPVIKMAQLFAEDGFNIVILSGRTDKTERTTRSWLSRNKVPFHKLVMRPHKTMNFVPDDILKKDMLDKYVDIDDVFLVVDDRDKVVKMWRSLGLPVFQVADGDF